MGLDLSGQVPFLEDVATYAGAVIDLQFAYLVLVEQEGFREVVRVMEERVMEDGSGGHVVVWNGQFDREFEGVGR